MVWGIRRDRHELIDELGSELIEWGENVASVYDPLPDDDGTLKPDDLILTPKVQPARKPRTRVVEVEHRDPKGKLMQCMVCGARETVDGRFCARHRGGY